ncbi:uncharacterized protein PG986_001983 [Apiospora aurea]|uniref:Uncharacterized protein n=1 Tax=Apiospora aurea TaxID=335848 RepID=A0ABR1QYE0_9PEZI
MRALGGPVPKMQRWCACSSQSGLLRKTGDGYHTGSQTTDFAVPTQPPPQHWRASACALPAWHGMAWHSMALPDTWTFPAEPRAGLAKAMSLRCPNTAWHQRTYQKPQPRDTEMRRECWVPVPRLDNDDIGTDGEGWTRKTVHNARLAADAAKLWFWTDHEVPDTEMEVSLTPLPPAGNWEGEPAPSLVEAVAAVEKQARSSSALHRFNEQTTKAA